MKNLFLTHERTVSRKLKEVWLSLDHGAGLHTKDEILAMYLNEVYLGRSRGMRASTGSGGRPEAVLRQGRIPALELPEAALLGGARPGSEPLLAPTPIPIPRHQPEEHRAGGSCASEGRITAGSAYRDRCPQAPGRRPR
ncbi:MAG: transglycosylase domain-containing protein [Desulfosudis oleivorans]|nr:transglycosylase domain-containing protein [Desulfosudis oleivorans]